MAEFFWKCNMLQRACYIPSIYKIWKNFTKRNPCNFYFSIRAASADVTKYQFDMFAWVKLSRSTPCVVFYCDCFTAHVLEVLFRNAVVLQREFKQFLSLWVISHSLLEVSMGWKSILVYQSLWTALKDHRTLNHCPRFSPPCSLLLLHRPLDCIACIPWISRSRVVCLNTVNLPEHNHKKSAYSGWQ